MCRNTSIIYANSMSSLFLAVFVVMFIIVRKRRIQNKKREEEAVGKIDLDDVEDRAAFSRQYGVMKK